MASTNITIEGGVVNNYIRSGNESHVGTNIFIHSLSSGALSPNKPLIVAETLPTATTFAGYVKIENSSPVTTPIYKAGHTYRLKKADETLYTVGIATPAPEGAGTLTVKWDEYDEKEVVLEGGDQVPASTELTVTATPASGNRLSQRHPAGSRRSNNRPYSGCSSDRSLVEFPFHPHAG